MLTIISGIIIPILIAVVYWKHLQFQSTKEIATRCCKALGMLTYWHQFEINYDTEIKTLDNIYFLNYVQYEIQVWLPQKLVRILLPAICPNPSVNKEIHKYYIKYAISILRRYIKSGWIKYLVDAYILRKYYPIVGQEPMISAMNIIPADISENPFQGKMNDLDQQLEDK